MGALKTKIAKTGCGKGKEKQFGDLRSNQTTKFAGKRRAEPQRDIQHLERQEGFFASHGADKHHIQSSVDGSTMKKRKSLSELKMESPPGFKYFEFKVDLQALDEETALELWEDIFKPLCS